MDRLTFLVNSGENGCYMVHGLDWACYAEGSDWQETADTVLTLVHQVFSEKGAPIHLDFRFSDGSVVSLSA